MANAQNVLGAAAALGVAVAASSDSKDVSTRLTNWHTLTSEVSPSASAESGGAAGFESAAEAG